MDGILEVLCDCNSKGFTYCKPIEVMMCYDDDDNDTLRLLPLLSMMPWFRLVIVITCSIFRRLCNPSSYKLKAHPASLVHSGKPAPVLQGPQFVRVAAALPDNAHYTPGIEEYYMCAIYDRHSRIL